MFRHHRWVLLSFILTLPPVAFAQGSDGPVQNKVSDPAREALERRTRETALHSITMIVGHKRDPREQHALIKQLNDDFKQIQIIRLEMVRDIAAGKSFEYKRLADDASEIRKRAARLKSSLALRSDNNADNAEAKATVFQADTIQAAASDLCVEISRFITNPLFKEGAVYNVRYAVEAHNVLNSIISLSTNIKTGADRLRRSN